MKLISNTFVESLHADADILSILDKLKSKIDTTDPFFICKLPEIVDKYISWNKMLPRVKPYYGVNSNSSCIIMETLAALGVGFECITKKDIDEATKAGCGSSLFLSSSLKTANLLKHAANSKVPFVCYDSEAELVKLKKMYPEANLLLHVKTVYDPDSMFCIGADPQFQCVNLLKKAREMEFNVVGLHFNIVPETGSLAYKKTIELAKSLFDDAALLGFQFNLLSLGSGFPSESVVQIADEVNNALKEHFPDETVEVMANAASFFVESAYILTCKIEYVHRSERKNPETGTTSVHYEYFINDGVFGNFSSVLANKQPLSLQPLKEYQQSQTFSSSVWGPTGSELDQIVEEVLLPVMDVGDLIIFDNMGTCSTSIHNGFPVQKVYFLTDDEVWVKVCGEDQKPKEVYFFMGNHMIQSKGPRRDSDESADPGMYIDLAELIKIQTSNDIQ